MKKTMMFALGMVTATVLTLGTVASAYQEDGAGQGRNFDPEHKAAMQEVLESGDYAAFAELVGDKKIGEVITEANFDKFVEMHSLIKDGDREGAGAIAEELGLPDKKHMKRFKRNNRDGKKHVNPEMREAMKTALENGDYSAWKELVGDNKLGELITEENFDRFVEMHSLIKDGDKEAAKAIAEELGLPDRKHWKKFREKHRNRKMYDNNGDGVCEVSEQEPIQTLEDES